MFSTGDVVLFFNKYADKMKFHLCVNCSGYYFYINSPKEHSFRGDFFVAREHLPFLPDQSHSVVSCSELMEFSSIQISRLQAIKKGTMPKEIFRDLVAFVEKTKVLKEDDKIKVYEGFRNWR